ncbi:MAG: hypothetical protein V2A76_05405 [Planctomycetota bacterium]
MNPLGDHSITRPTRGALPLFLRAAGLFFFCGIFASSLLAARAVLDAETILAQAAKAQQAGDLARDVRSVELSLYIQIRDKEGARIELDVERKFQLPNMLWTRISNKDLSSSVQQTGFDGKVAWNLEEKRGKAILLEGPDYKQDRTEIQNDLESMRKLIDFFFLENLRKKLHDLERLPDSASESDDIRCWVVKARGDLDVRSGGPATVTFWIEQESYRLLGARLVPDDQPETSEQFCFWHHAKTPQGMVLPGSVTIYRNGEEQFSEKLALRTVEGKDGAVLNNITFNRELDKELFSPPDD